MEPLIIVLISGIAAGVGIGIVATKGMKIYLANRQVKKRIE